MVMYDQIILGNVGITRRDQIELEHLKDLLYGFGIGREQTDKILNRVTGMTLSQGYQCSIITSSGYEIFIQIRKIACSDQTRYSIEALVSLDRKKNEEKENGREIEQEVSGQCDSADQGS